MKMSNTTKTADIDEELRKPLVEDVEKQQEPVKTARPIVVTVPKKRGMPCCCKCTLITLSVLFLLGAVTTCFVYHSMAEVVQEFTVTTPHDQYPIVEMTDKELDIVKDRVESFVGQLTTGPLPQDPLVITQDEINGFIGHSDFLRGNMFVTLKKGAILEELSLPTEMLPGGKGRYFVADESFQIDEQDHKVTVRAETAATHHDLFDGPLLVAQLQYLVSDIKGAKMMELYLTKGSFFGQVAPQEWIDQRQNLLEDLYKDPDAEEARAIVENIERVTIEAGKIVVQPRQHN